MSRIWLSPPHVGPRERELLLDAFDSNWIAPLGPHVDAFEREMAVRTGMPHAAALSSGTAGLHLALLLLGVGVGDLVITATLTFAATANAITYVGAVPVFVDAEPATWTMDPDLLDEALTTLEREGRPAKAVIAVDLYGQVCDPRIETICEAHGVPLVEDAAEALGSVRAGRPAGSFGAMAVLSFNGNKIITTAGGGMLLARDAEHVKRARYLATQARDPAPHYQHSVVGYNYRMSNLLAAVGRGQLEALDDRIAARRATRDTYVRTLGTLPGWSFLEDPADATTNAWLSCAVIDPAEAGVDREAVRLHLEADQIEARPVWKPMHQQPVFDGCRTFGGDVSDRLFRDGLCLPSGSSLTDADRDRIVARVRTTPRGGA
ncbi:MAG: aminotransferase class I/II-fold pyridoxal phosphate-dependent enzyme [Alphaproteobacteria bacterium]|nr:aminotransferase class I/II-fold pyridoxal phosphate-dependent enzyme [Alphaproteobacteria bacterium]MCB9697343.1 aminotransferase class I/II-fold pyridoxal phosphate-dependent enzyme [Alphaproteobacteria bacterium]